MGTSSSGKGRSSRSPLVPAHADANPDQPLPEPGPNTQRFRGFRTEFGRAVEGTGAGNFNSALRKYARNATGGVSIGPRRFGTAYVSGGALIALLNELSQGGTGEKSTGVDLSSLVGKPVEEAIEKIAQTLAPENADADFIRISVQEALEEVFPELDSFEPAVLTPDDFVTILVEFFSKLLFLIVTDDAGNAWSKAPDDKRTIDAENQLFDIIRASVDNNFSPKFTDNIQNVTKAEIETLERLAMDDVWAEWESYK